MTDRLVDGLDFEASMKSALANKGGREFTYFAGDFTPERFSQWSSVWYQAGTAIMDPEVSSVLEFGAGRGVNKALVEHFGIRHVSVDVNSRFEPDVCASIEDYSGTEMFDLVCAFEVLEHNPFEDVPAYIRKFRKLARKYVFISLPYSGRWISVHLNVNLPKLRNIDRHFSFCFERLRKKVRPVEDYRKRPDRYNPHWWEVGDRDTPARRVVSMLESQDLRVLKQFNNPLFPQHIFFLCECV